MWSELESDCESPKCCAAEVSMIVEVSDSETSSSEVDRILAGDLSELLSFMLC